MKVTGSGPSGEPRSPPPPRVYAGCQHLTQNKAALAVGSSLPRPQLKVRPERPHPRTGKHTHPRSHVKTKGTSFILKPCDHIRNVGLTSDVPQMPSGALAPVPCPNKQMDLCSLLLFPRFLLLFPSHANTASGALHSAGAKILLCVFKRPCEGKIKLFSLSWLSSLTETKHLSFLFFFFITPPNSLKCHRNTSSWCRAGGQQQCQSR